MMQIGPVPRRTAAEAALRRDGIDAAIAIRARYGIRCVFASAYADDEASARAQAAEPLGFVSKPFTRASLIEAVERCAGLL